MTLTKEELEQIAEISAKTTTAILDKKETDKGTIVNKFTPGAGIEGKVVVTLDEGDKPFKSFGEQLMAVKNAEYISKGQAKGAVDKRLYGVQQKATGTSELVPADGGFLVAQEFIPTIISREHKTGIVWSKTRKQPVGPNYNGFKVPMINEVSRADGSRMGGIQGYWLAEAGTLTKSKPGFRQISLELQKLICMCYCTDELLQDAVALEGFVNLWFPEEFGFKLDDAVINGDGAGKPLGILNSPALYSVAIETGQTLASGGLVSQNIMKMWQSMYAPSRSTCEWFINQELEVKLDQLSLAVGTGGIPVYMNLNMGITEDGLMKLKGRPVNIIEQCSALGTVGDIILADMNQYMMGSKGDINAATSIHVQFVTDETAFRWTYRCNGQPMWNSTLTPYKGSIKMSPFVTLAART
jgi:HK97 family phage major capsid protein